jgi:hypothetical protein
MTIRKERKKRFRLGGEPRYLYLEELDDAIVGETMRYEQTGQTPQKLTFTLSYFVVWRTILGERASYEGGVM